MEGNENNYSVFEHIINSELKIKKDYFILIKFTLKGKRVRTAGFAFYFYIKRVIFFCLRLSLAEDEYKGDSIIWVHAVGRYIGEIVKSDIKLPNKIIPKNANSSFSNFNTINTAEKKIFFLLYFPLTNDLSLLGTILNPKSRNSTEVILEYKNGKETVSITLKN